MFHVHERFRELFANGNLQKNKGRIESDNTVADYVILDSAKEKDFAILLSSTILAGKTPLRASFVHDCVEECSLLDTADYSHLGSQVQKPKRGRPLVGGSPLLVKHALDQKHKADSKKTRQDANERKMKKADGRIEKQAKTTTSENPASLTHTRSPSPPPEHTRIPLSGGKYQYSPEEQDYLRRYARYLFERDPYESNNSMAQKLHKKVYFHDGPPLLPHAHHCAGSHPFCPSLADLYEYKVLN
jgi:hypothetical protein